MRIYVGLLTCLAVGALTSVFADPASPLPAATTAPAAAAEKPAAQAPAEAPAAAPATASREESDEDTRHFLAEGYKPEMHGGQQLYCRKETVLGSRLTAIKSCATIRELRVKEARAQSDVHQSQDH